MNAPLMLMIALHSQSVLMQMMGMHVFVWTVSLTRPLLTDFYLVESVAMVGLCF